MDEGTVLGSVEFYPDSVSDLTQSLELADCDSSVESGTLEAGVTVVSPDGGNKLCNGQKTLPHTELGQLKALLAKYWDVCALADDVQFSCSAKH